MQNQGIPVNRLTLREQVLELLRGAITSGEFAHGASLTETDLAERYQVSRGTVREALRELQAAGLVVGDSRARLSVWEPSRSEITEMFRVRGALEGLAAQEIMSSEDRSELIASLRASLPPKAEEKLTFRERMARDMAFHESLVQLSGNETLLGLWRGLQDRMRVVFYTGGSSEDMRLMTREQHEPIVEAIEGDDHLTAHRVLQEHMSDAEQLWAR